MIDSIEGIAPALWAVAFLVVTYAIGNYLSGVIEFRDWKWPWR